MCTSSNRSINTSRIDRSSHPHYAPQWT
jgi:hypothetical protein